MYCSLLAARCSTSALLVLRRRIEKPRIVLLDCALEYKKGESQVRSSDDHLHTVAAHLSPIELH